MRRKWTTEEIRKLVQRYPSEGAGALLLELRRNANSVHSKARQYGLHNKSRRQSQGRSKATNCPTVNARFFDEPNEEVAYVLGFLWASATVKLNPRRVLRISCQRHHRLTEVLSKIESRHQIQRHGNRSVAEVCNSELVQSLIVKFGRPDGEALPPLSSEFIPSFAQGHLDASGSEVATCTRWTGRTHHIESLVSLIRLHAQVGQPTATPNGKLLHAAWCDERESQKIRRWLKTH